MSWQWSQSQRSSSLLLPSKTQWFLPLLKSSLESPALCILLPSLNLDWEEFKRMESVHCCRKFWANPHAIPFSGHALADRSMKNYFSFSLWVDRYLLGLNYGIYWWENIELNCACQNICWNPNPLGPKNVTLFYSPFDNSENTFRCCKYMLIITLIMIVQSWRLIQFIHFISFPSSPPPPQIHIIWGFFVLQGQSWEIAIQTYVGHKTKNSYYLAL